MRFRTLIIVNIICTISTGFVALFLLEGLVRVKNLFLLPLSILIALVVFAIYNFSKLFLEKYKGKITILPYYILMFTLLLLFIWVFIPIVTGRNDLLFEIGNAITDFLYNPSIMRLYLVCASILPIMQIISLSSGMIITAYIQRQKSLNGMDKRAVFMRYGTLILINIVCTLSTGFVVIFFLLSWHKAHNATLWPLLLAIALTMFAFYNFWKLFSRKYECKISILPYYLLIFILLLLFLWLLVLVLTDQYTELLKISYFLMPFLDQRSINRLFNLYEIILITQIVSLTSMLIITTCIRVSRQ